MTETLSPPKGFADKVIFGAIAAVMSAMFALLLGILGYLLSAVMTTNDRLTTLETTVREVSRERAYQIDEIRGRLDRLESDRAP